MWQQPSNGGSCLNIHLLCLPEASGFILQQRSLIELDSKLIVTQPHRRRQRTVLDAAARLGGLVQHLVRS